MASVVPHFHDALLTGVVLDEASATVYLRQVSGEEYALVLSGLEVLQMEDFRQGNIISMVKVVSGRLPYEHAGLERRFTPPHSEAADEFHAAHKTVLERQSARIASGEVSLLIIVPSWGADLLAICREVNAMTRKKDGS